MKKNDFETDLIIGLHSIFEAICNTSRNDKVLYATDEGLKKLLKVYKSISLKNVDIKQLTSNNFLKKTQNFYAKRNFDYSRIPSGLLLEASSLTIDGPQWVFQNAIKKPSKIFALDSVTDIHNGAAIMRTAAFYGVDAFVISQKGNFGTTPSFFRLASGAPEHIKMIRCSNLSRFVARLQENEVRCIGLSEHAEDESFEKNSDKSCCLIVGHEETGISNAVMRILNHKVSLKSQGCIKSLNVSVAAGIAMEKFF